MSWKPTTDFEEELISLQPHHNFIFGELCQAEPEVFYPRPKAHLEYAKKKKDRRNESAFGEEKEGSKTRNEKLNIIAEVQRITGSKPLGELPTVDDWNSRKNVEAETIAMMRNCGLGPSTEHALDEKRTLSTLPIEKRIAVNRRGRRSMPIILDDDFFKWDVDYTQPAPELSDVVINDYESASTSHESSTASSPSKFNKFYDSCDLEKRRKKFERLNTVDYERLTSDSNESSLVCSVPSNESQSESDEKISGLKNKTPVFNCSAKLNRKPEQHNLKDEDRRKHFTAPNNSSNNYSQPRFYKPKDVYQLRRHNKI